MGDFTLMINGTPIEVIASKVVPSGVYTPKLVQRDAKGNKLYKKRKTETGEIFESFNYIWVDEDDNEVSPSEIKEYEVQDDGTEELVSLFTKTNIVEFKNTLPAQFKDALLQEGLYTIYTANTEGAMLLEEALVDAMVRNVVYYKEGFVWKKGMTQYHAIFYPYRHSDGSFAWMLMTTRGKATLKGLMQSKAKQEVKQEGKKLETLSSLSALIQTEG